MGKYSLQQVKKNEAGDFTGGLSFKDAPCSTSSIDAAMDNLTETPLFITTALAQMRDALEMIADEDKKDYLEALRLAPVLVQTESNPVKFLRVDDFNPWKSARRLVLYWGYRRKYFKKSRWLLSLHDDSGAGALDEEDVQLLKSGWLAVVAPKDPKYGRFIIVNHGRYPRQDVESRMRVCFYLCSAASDIPSQVEPGLMGIRLIPAAEPGGKEPEFTNPRFANAKVIFKMMKEALPIRFRGVMLLAFDADTRSKIVNLGFSQITSLFSALLNTQRPFIVPVSNVSEAAEKLFPFGIPPEVLPESHGDSVDRRYQSLRRQGQGGKCSGTSVGDVAVCVFRGLDEVCLTVVRILPPRAETQYARRAYHKRKLKLSEHKDEAKRLKIDNERLKNENALLESLLQQASVIAALVKDEEPALPDIEVGDDEPFDNPILPPGSSFDAFFALELQRRFG
eukprot:scaffold7190_cov193-Amphora_coffeaeformis.AAC.13